MGGSVPELPAIRAAARDLTGLQLLVLFGSRARGEAHAGSDWDFAFRAAPGFAPDELVRKLALALGTDRIDVADLDRAGALLRFRAAKDGLPAFEARTGLFLQFQEDASLFWCDVEPVLRRAYEGVLAGLS